VIVTCEQCTTQFKLDDAKIPSGGARVRCSRCQHAFFIEPPHYDDHARVDALTHAVLGSDPSADSPPDTSASSDEGEADWKFNEDAPAGAPESGPFPSADPKPKLNLGAARDAVNDLLGSEGSALEGASAGLVVEDLGGSDLDSEDLGLELAGPHPESALENPESADPISETEVRDTSDPMGIEAQTESHPHQGHTLFAPAGTSAGDLLDLGSGVESLARGDIDDDLGSPRNWDFFAEGQDDSEAEAAKTAVARVGLIPRWKLLEQEQEQARQLELSALEETAAASELDVQQGPSSRALRQAGHGLGWIATVALVAAGVWSTLGPNRIDRGAPVPLQVIGDLEVEVLASRWIDNAISGPVYVVSGELRSIGSGEPVAVGGLGIQLLDATGAPLALSATRIATPRHPSHLRESGPEALATEFETGAHSLARLRLRTGDGVPFQGVLTDLPPEAARFRVIAAPLVPDRSSRAPIRPSSAASPR
jgi:predicted Zn finger-like uncharacterized protein